ncbi:hypothetical protein K505DRAFT_373373 [Melanomma pulvis-pyrius CBS 109.77]|uniref:Uncharacterized protein n=1 Tax=Melanomma pulvis-pyrius CBS 109.77 TaxID=1314802 RepID=A0A6A6XI35_9PLEO|nr:hypothetical protein K505DRAFT_373373 [Melanomma pulvis-pyrius CBS 109.77]
MATKSTVIRACSLQKFTAEFSFNQTVLETNVKAFNPEYHKEKPKTWPLITAEALRLADKKEYDGEKNLPTNVAYDETIIQIWLSKNLHAIWLQGCAGAEGPSKLLGFLGYPFTFETSGALREVQEMTESDYDKWVRCDFPEITNASAYPRCRRSSSDDKTVSPKIAFEQVMQRLAKSGGSPLSEIDRVERKLQLEMMRANAAETKTNANEEHFRGMLTEIMKQKILVEEHIGAIENQCKKETERVESLEQRLKTDSKRASEAEAKAQTLEAQSKTERARADIAEGEVKTLKQQLEQRDRQLARAQKETAEANQRIVEIWTRMKKTDTSEASPTGKRSAPGGDAEEERVLKRSKTVSM